MFPPDWPAARDINTLNRLAGKKTHPRIHDRAIEHNRVERLETLTGFTVNERYRQPLWAKSSIFI